MMSYYTLTVVNGLLETFIISGEEPIRVIHSGRPRLAHKAPQGSPGSESSPDALLVWRSTVMPTANCAANHRNDGAG